MTVADQGDHEGRIQNSPEALPVRLSSLPIDLDVEILVVKFDAAFAFPFPFFENYFDFLAESQQGGSGEAFPLLLGLALTTVALFDFCFARAQDLDLIARVAGKFQLQSPRIEAAKLRGAIRGSRVQNAGQLAFGILRGWFGSAPASSQAD